MIFERFAACKAHRFVCVDSIRAAWVSYPSAICLIISSSSERNYRVSRARQATDNRGQTDKMEMKHRAASDDRKWTRESRGQDEHKQIKQHNFEREDDEGSSTRVSGINSLTSGTFRSCYRQRRWGYLLNWSLPLELLLLLLLLASAILVARRVL